MSKAPVESGFPSDPEALSLYGESLAIEVLAGAHCKKEWLNFFGVTGFSSRDSSSSLIESWSSWLSLGSYSLKSLFDDYSFAKAGV